MMDGLTQLYCNRQDASGLTTRLDMSSSSGVFAQASHAAPHIRAVAWVESGVHSRSGSCDWLEAFPLSSWWAPISVASRNGLALVDDFPTSRQVHATTLATRVVFCAGSGEPRPGESTPCRHDVPARPFLTPSSSRFPTTHRQMWTACEAWGRRRTSDMRLLRWTARIADGRPHGSLDVSAPHSSNRRWSRQLCRDFAGAATSAGTSGTEAQPRRRPGERLAAIGRTGALGKPRGDWAPQRPGRLPSVHSPKRRSFGRALPGAWSRGLRQARAM